MANGPNTRSRAQTSSDQAPTIAQLGNTPAANPPAPTADVVTHFLQNLCELPANCALEQALVANNFTTFTSLSSLATGGYEFLKTEFPSVPRAELCNLSVLGCFLNHNRILGTPIDRDHWHQVTLSELDAFRHSPEHSQLLMPIPPPQHPN